MDGVDAAWLETDGQMVTAFGPAEAVNYAPDFRARLHSFVSSVPERTDPRAGALEADLTELHAQAVRAVIRKAGHAPDLIGFHGQTVWHRPHLRQTWQLGNGARLAKAMNIPVVFDFRSNDVAQGGQGAPLLPLFHAALAAHFPKPVAVLNVGGVSNLTWLDDHRIPPSAMAFPFAILGFDTGPGNALIDDWMLKHTGQIMDRDGAAARVGRVDQTCLTTLMDVPFFKQPPPKSLDRLAFDPTIIDSLGVNDGAATLVEFTAATIAASLAHCPTKPKRILVTGGGRHNPVLMARIAALCDIQTDPVEAAGWDGDAMEAQGFAYFAARFVRGLPLTYPEVTGAPTPLCGGVLVHP